MWINPLKTVFDYYERSGVRRDIHWFKRMFVEIPHIPIGAAIAIVSITAAYVKLNYFFEQGIGYQSRYLVLRPDDPRLLRFRKDVIEAEKAGSK